MAFPTPVKRVPGIKWEWAYFSVKEDAQTFADHWKAQGYQVDAPRQEPTTLLWGVHWRVYGPSN